MGDWVEVADLASRYGISHRDVIALARLVGVDGSRVHAKWHGGRLSLSRPAADLVVVEIKARQRERGNADGSSAVDGQGAVTMGTRHKESTMRR